MLAVGQEVRMSVRALRACGLNRYRLGFPSRRRHLKQGTAVICAEYDHPLRSPCPPVIRAASQSICELPPEIVVLLTFPIHPNAIHRLSPDHKSSMTSSV